MSFHLLFPSLDLFVFLLTFNQLSPFCPLSPVVSHLSFLTPLLPACLSVCWFLAMLSSLVLVSFSSLSYSPSAWISFSLSDHHILSSQRTWQLSRCREWTMTSFPLSNTPRVGQAKARPWVGISVNVTIQSRRVTAEFGKLTGFTALVQQGQSTERTQRTLNWGQGGGMTTCEYYLPENIFLISTDKSTEYGFHHQWVSGSKCTVILSSPPF